MIAAPTPTPLLEAPKSTTDELLAQLMKAREEDKKFYTDRWSESQSHMHKLEVQLSQLARSQNEQQREGKGHEFPSTTERNPKHQVNVVNAVLRSGRGFTNYEDEDAPIEEGEDEESDESDDTPLVSSPLPRVTSESPSREKAVRFHNDAEIIPFENVEASDDEEDEEWLDIVRSRADSRHLGNSGGGQEHEGSSQDRTGEESKKKGQHCPVSSMDREQSSIHRSKQAEPKAAAKQQISMDRASPSIHRNTSPEAAQQPSMDRATTSIHRSIPAEAEQQQPNIPSTDKDTPLPFPHVKNKERAQANLDKKTKECLNVFKKVEINLPLLDAIQAIPLYARFLKDYCTHRRLRHKFQGEGESEQVELNATVSAIIQRKVPPKLSDPGSFTVPCTIGKREFPKTLMDLGASINLMPYSVYEELGLGKIKKVGMSLQLADRSIVHPRGVVEDVLVKIGELVIPADLVILDMDAPRGSDDLPIIFGRAFMATAGTKIDVKGGVLTMDVFDKRETFEIFHDRVSSPKYHVKSIEAMHPRVKSGQGPRKAKPKANKELKPEKVAKGSHVTLTRSPSSSTTCYKVLEMSPSGAVQLRNLVNGKIMELGYDQVKLVTGASKRFGGRVYHCKDPTTC